MSDNKFIFILGKLTPADFLCLISNEVDSRNQGYVSVQPPSLHREPRTCHLEKKTTLPHVMH
jgi:hypothetical protein